MPWNRKKVEPSETLVEIVYDDGGSGLQAACTERFAGYGCRIECDERHTVWVKNVEGSYTVGIAIWLVERQGLERTLDEVEAKLRAFRAEREALTPTAPGSRL